MREFVMFSITVSIIFVVIFFVIQLVSSSRSPIKVFIGPITNSEFKIFLSLVANHLEKKEYSPTYSGVEISMPNYYIYSGSYGLTVNGVYLSYFQERKLKRTIERAKLKASILTKAGSVLYSKGS